MADPDDQSIPKPQQVAIQIKTKSDGSGSILIPPVNKYIRIDISSKFKAVADLMSFTFIDPDKIKPPSPIEVVEKPKLVLPGQE